MARLAVKAGVQPKVIEMMALLAQAAASLDEPVEVVITSGIDGHHSTRSLHYALRALDVRSHNFPSLTAKREFEGRLRLVFGPEYDILLEGLGTPHEHFHIEWDPS
jgi:hypothetical protein